MFTGGPGVCLLPPCTAAGRTVDRRNPRKNPCTPAGTQGCIQGIIRSIVLLKSQLNTEREKVMPALHMGQVPTCM